MEVAKTFDRDGVRYRPGDTLPEGLDKQTLEHYKRHGMVREVKPQETKPVAQRRRTAHEPKQIKPAAPLETKDTGQSLLEQSLQGSEQSQQTGEGPTDQADSGAASDDGAAASQSADLQDAAKD